MSNWKITGPPRFFDGVGMVYLVGKGGSRFNAAEEDELKALLAGWQPIETAPKDELVFLYSPPQSGDYPDDIRIDVDFFDSENDCWYNHHENREHFECVAPPGSQGPSVEAPYTHWRPYFTSPTN
ncbi:hypothetical protein [Halomonas sp. BMC6]|uniref:hypothetical protein n=1 Tax=Halomonas sp. BMC6 TaxID=3073244 RepID=UPI0030CC8B74